MLLAIGSHWNPPIHSPYSGGAVNGQVAVLAGGHLKVLAPRGVSRRSGSGSSFLAGFAHAVALSVGDDHVGVVKESVDERAGGGVLG